MAQEGYNKPLTLPNAGLPLSILSIAILADDDTDSLNSKLGGNIIGLKTLNERMLTRRWGVYVLTLNVPLRFLVDTTGVASYCLKCFRGQG